MPHVAQLNMAHLRYLTDKSRIGTVSEAEEPLEDIKKKLIAVISYCTWAKHPS